MRLGVDVLLSDRKLRSALSGRRVAYLGHPASMTTDFRHSVDALMSFPETRLVSAFGPQHGMRGDKQDNMVESDDYVDPIHQIPVFSLYGKVRRPTDEMLDTFDVLLFDVQDLGCRIYTFLTTLLYVLEGCARRKKAVWVLDRPNPAGRPVEGTVLKAGWESFVGASAGIPMRHGLTLGEFARWFVQTLKLDVEFKVVAMEGYSLEEAPGYGWPVGQLSWVNPSPNAASLNMARCYAGTVMVEGTTLSEARGTTRPLETVGAPDLDTLTLLKRMSDLAPQWMEGARIRPCFFEPTFHKHRNVLNAGFQIHADDQSYDHSKFKPYRLIALWFKAIRLERPDYPIWRDFPYEYETDRLAIDLINGGTELREWVDDPSATAEDFERILGSEERQWEQLRREFLLYS